MDEGTLLEWLVKPGDEVHKGDIIAVVDTAKSAIEVESFHTGTIAELITPVGETVPVGTVLATITEAGAEVGGTGAAEPGGRAAGVAEAGQPRRGGGRCARGGRRAGRDGCDDSGSCPPSSGSRGAEEQARAGQACAGKGPSGQEARAAGPRRHTARPWSGTRPRSSGSIWPPCTALARAERSPGQTSSMRPHPGGAG